MKYHEHKKSNWHELYIGKKMISSYNVIENEESVVNLFLNNLNQK